jgi:hypothetical protein
MNFFRKLLAAAGIGLAAGSAAASEAPPSDPVQASEQALAKLIRDQGEQPVGDIRANAENGELGSYQGAVMVGTNTRRQVDLTQLASDRGSGADRLYEHLRRLLDASSSVPQGRWYHLIVEAREDGTIHFEYFRENEQLESIAQLKLDQYGFVPAYVYVQRFDPGLVAELSDHEVNAGIASHVPARLAAGKPVSPELMELLATIDWEGDVNNGGLDQYFAREHSDYTGAPRRGYYPLVRAGLKRIGADGAAGIFDESIALWAHFHPRVEAARASMGVAPLPRREESDIDGRYYLHSKDLGRLRAAYVRAHPEILEPRPAQGGL